MGAVVRMRLEFTTEPFDLAEPPAHALTAREVLRDAESGGALAAVEVGPFGNTAEGERDAVVAAVGELLRRTTEAGATRISLQVSVVDGAER